MSPRSFVQVMVMLLVLSAVSFQAEAQSTLYPNVWRRSQGLPAGQSLFTLTSNFSRYSNQLSESGDSVGIGEAYGQSITWAELLADRGEPNLKNQQLREYVKGRGMDLDSIAATADLNVSQEVLSFSPQWAYGMTSSWMLGLRLPVVYRRTQVSSKISVSEEYSRLAATAEPLAQAELNSPDRDLRIKDALNRKLSDHNYEPIETDQKEWLLGDAEILSKFEILQTPDLLWSLRERVVLPTASAKSPYRYVDASEGDGQLDIGVDSIVDYWIGHGWLVTGSLGYTWQAPDQIKARLPGVADQLGQDVALEVNRNLGDYWSTSAFVEKSLHNQWRIFSGYSYLKKDEDTYEGAQYEALAEGSKQELHMGHLGLSYKAEPFSQRRGLKTQLASSVYFSSVLAGSNVPDSSLAGLDLQLLF